MHRYILALDQGTTSSRALLVRRDGSVAATAQQEIGQSYPAPGFVEHDPEEIWRTQRDCAREAIVRAGARTEEIAAIGIAVQREPTSVWDRADGRPIHPAIVWQCRRTADLCEKLKRSRSGALVRQKTGLVVDPYFSATKIGWILDHVRGARRRAERGELLFGTVDSWLLWRLTGGRVHATDVSNASRTLLFDLRRGRFDDGLLKTFRTPRAMLPEIRDTDGDFGLTDPEHFGLAVPIRAVMGDQQAALFGQGRLKPGGMKNTYGTGCFLLMNAGDSPPAPPPGILATAAWRRGGRTTYALEGGVFVAGAAVQWLRDALRVIGAAAETEALAEGLGGNDGVYFVPAFAGLGAPHWDPHARGAIFGLTRGTGIAHLARAALEAMAYQTRDLVEAITAKAGVRPRELRVDGGAVRNDFLCQFQADMLGIPVVRPAATESTALGAAYMAGLAAGFWRSEREVAALRRIDRVFEPRIGRAERERLYAGWKNAVARTLSRA